MKEFSLVIWLTQLGLSVAAPLMGFVLLGIWLRSCFGWGIWSVWCCILLGLLSGVSGFRSALNMMVQMTEENQPSEPPTVSFNDHA